MPVSKLRAASRYVQYDKAMAGAHGERTPGAQLVMSTLSADLCVRGGISQTPCRRMHHDGQADQLPRPAKPKIRSLLLVLVL